MPYIKVKLQSENEKIRLAANKLNSFNPKLKKPEKILNKSNGKTNKNMDE